MYIGNIGNRTERQEIAIPENYGGTSLVTGSAEAPATEEEPAIRAVPREVKYATEPGDTPTFAPPEREEAADVPPAEEVAASATSKRTRFPTGGIFPDAILKRVVGFLPDLFAGSGGREGEKPSFGLPDMNAEDFLLLAIGCYLFFAHDGDKTTALLLFALLFVH